MKIQRFDWDYDSIINCDDGNYVCVADVATALREGLTEYPHKDFEAGYNKAIREVLEALNEREH